MRLPILLLLSAGAALLPAASLAQEVAGRMLVAVGDVAIVRGAQRIDARTGTEVRAGDTIELGAQSNAQIRLSDESIVALRSGTTFRISEYAFQGRAPEEQRVLFDLLKGGLRTVTGIIGRARQDRYGVMTPTATIGIRGTHYTLVHCDNDCDAPGARADAGGTLLASAMMLAQTDAGPGERKRVPNGTYGAVTDNVITVTNTTGTTEYGKDQYFFVASRDTRPERLIGPPEHLKEVRSTIRPKTAAPVPGAAVAQQPTSSGGESAPTVALTGASGGTGDLGVSSGVSGGAEIPPALSTNVFLPTESATAQGPATILQPTFTGTVFYRIQGPFSIQLNCTNPPCERFTAGDITLGVNFALQLAGVSVSVKDTVSGDIVNIGTPGSSPGIPITVNGGQATFSGTFNLADNPQNQGAFRCNKCGPNDTVGFLSSMTFSGTISGSQATLTVSGSSPNGESGSATVSLAQAIPPNNDVAAMVTPNLAGGASARSAAFWGVQLDGARKLIDFGPTVGQIRANVGSANNTIAGSRPDAGNLVWGAWTGPGAQVTDFNYASFTTGVGAVLPWITGNATNTLPPSLGTLSYTPVGGLINNGFAVLNSGSLTADFVNRSLSLNLDTTRTSGELNRFVMSGASSFSSTTGRFSAGFANVQCVSGPCSTGGNQIGGSFGGFFAGQQAEGAGVAFTAGFGIGNGVSGVAAFKR